MMTTLGTGNIIQGTVIVIEITMAVADIVPALTHQGVVTESSDAS